MVDFNHEEIRFSEEITKCNEMQGVQFNLSGLHDVTSIPLR